MTEMSEMSKMADLEMNLMEESEGTDDARSGVSGWRVSVS